MPGDLRALLGRRLEAGDGSKLARAGAAAWGLVSSRAVARPLRLPRGAQVLGVGGAVLGGAGKTPLSIALARAFAARGARVALIGHAYRARPEHPRAVQPLDRVEHAGDDAVAAARMLAGTGAAVIVAPRRRDALDYAASLGHDLLVVDGLLQAAPRRLDAAVLVVDATAPWGSGACPPAGDLRAPRASLLAAADHVAAILPQHASLGPELMRLSAITVPSRIDGALGPAGERVAMDALASLRLGLVLAIARPSRVVSALASHGIRPDPVVTLADHAVPDARAVAHAARAPVDAWLTTARCATKLPSRLGGAPVWILEQRLAVWDLAEALRIHLER